MYKFLEKDRVAKGSKEAVNDNNQDMYLSLAQKGLIAIGFAVAIIIALFGMVTGGPGT